MPRFNRYLIALAVVLSAASPGAPSDTAYFVPTHRLPGIGSARQPLTDETLAARTEAMIQSQTFGIMREPLAEQGAARIWSSGLQRLFHEAERRTGFPASTLQAMAFIESWGVASAVSPAGPRGIMQMSEATGKRIGLRIVYSTRRRTVKTQVTVRNKHGKLVTRTKRHKETYTAMVRDDRLKPEKAIPAAAEYLAGMEQRYGGRDWAIWAYHCGEGCISEFKTVARNAGLDDSASVAKVFFSCSPVWNRELSQAIHAQMERDYSPTYWFRVMRAEQLLRMYLEDPIEFHDLVEQYKYAASPTQRAPDRLAAWLKPQDLIFQTSDHIKGEDGSKLVAAPDDPEFFGYRLGLSGGVDGDNWRAKAMPSTIGTMAYIAFETRRLYAEMRPDDAFVPLDVTALVVPTGDSPPSNLQGTRLPDHASGQVFDLSLSSLPPGEEECLQFVLDDLGWNGSLGFIEDPAAKQTMHIGCSPSSRDFFAQIYQEAQTAWQDRHTPPTTVPAVAQ